MHDSDETPPPSRDARGTSVPNEWGNALARKWAAEIPRNLTGGWLRTMYALRALASADGRLRYRSGDTITIREIAAAARADIKDVRRWITAAIAAGIVCAPEGRHAGRTVLYALLLDPRPNWAAAEAVELQGRRHGRDPVVWPTRVDNVDPDDITTAAAATAAEDVEHDAARDSDPTPGRAAPTPTEGHRAPTSRPTTPGHRAPGHPGAPRPQGVGAPRPHQPGDDHETDQDVVPYETEVQTARPRELAEDLDAGHRPALAPVPDPPPGARARGRAVPPGQPPLLMSVPGQPPPVPERVTADQVRTVGWREALGFALGARPHPETGT